MTDITQAVDVDNFDFDDDDGFDYVDADLRCHQCRGTGWVNPLTTPDWHLCLSGLDTCPVCDGTGEVA